MPRILLIDDDNLFRTMLREMLEEDGYDVVEAATSGEGIEAFDCREFDVIITDLFIPREGGLGVIKHVRAHDPAIGIIVISGMIIKNRTDIFNQMLDAGATHTLPKPIDREKLNQLIEDMLTGARKTSG